MKTRTDLQAPSLTGLISKGATVEFPSDIYHRSYGSLDH